MKKNTQRELPFRISRKTLYVMSFLTLVALATVGYLLAPTYNSASTALAQDGVKREGVTTEMLSRALDFRSVSDLSVFAQNGITDK